LGEKQTLGEKSITNNEMSAMQSMNMASMESMETQMSSTLDVFD
jgi:hypothetical protein